MERFSPTFVKVFEEESLLFLLIYVTGQLQHQIMLKYIRCQIYQCYTRTTFNFKCPCNLHNLIFIIFDAISFLPLFILRLFKSQAIRPAAFSGGGLASYASVVTGIW